MTDLDDEALIGLVRTIGEVINDFMDEHPEIPIDTVAATVSYVQGAMFRLASEIPPSKLH